MNTRESQFKKVIAGFQALSPKQQLRVLKKAKAIVAENRAVVQDNGRYNGDHNEQ